MSGDTLHHVIRWNVVTPRAAATSRPIDGFSVMINLMTLCSERRPT